MKPTLLVGALAVLALAVQGALADALPRWAVPDLSLLVVLTAALQLGALEAVVIAFVAGLGADMMSGSLLGEHACVRLFEVVAVRSLAAQLDLRRTLPIAVVAAGLAAIDALAVLGLDRAFLGAVPLHPADGLAVLGRAFFSGLGAPLVDGAVASGLERMRADEARREMRLETRRPVL